MSAELGVYDRNQLAVLPAETLPDDGPWLTDASVAIVVAAMRAEKQFDDMTVLADALEDCGSPRFLIDHARNVGHRGLGDARGCWFGRCWLLDYLEEEDQLVVARLVDGRFTTLCQVLNPGDYYGGGFFLYAEDCYQPPIFFVEGTADDAMDVFLASDAMRGYRIGTGEGEMNPKEYGDRRGHLWIDLLGGVGVDQLKSYQTTSNGLHVDAECVRYATAESEGLSGLGMHQRVTYYAPGRPVGGFPSTLYGSTNTCDNCRKVFCEGYVGSPLYCSEACMREYTAKYCDYD